MPSKVPGKLEERYILFANVVQNADRALLLGGKPDDIAAGAAELALQRLYPRCRQVEMPLK